MGLSHFKRPTVVVRHVEPRGKSDDRNGHSGLDTLHGDAGTETKPVH